MSDQTDRELLELAAKAGGMQSESRTLDGGYWIPEGSDLQRPWNPLTDDGDALRLAVKLKLVVDVGGYSTSVVVPAATKDPRELHKSDPCAATRRAIVRAAAAIAQNGATK